LGFLSDLHGLLIHFVLAVTMSATKKGRLTLVVPLDKSAHTRKKRIFSHNLPHIAS